MTMLRRQVLTEAGDADHEGHDHSDETAVAAEEGTGFRGMHRILRIQNLKLLMQLPTPTPTLK